MRATLRRRLRDGHYHPSGRVNPTGLAWSVPASLLVAGGLGVLYGVACAHDPVADWGSCVLTVAFAVAVAWTTGHLLIWGHLRNPRLAAAAGAVAGIVGLYIAWVTWAFLILQQHHEPEAIAALAWPAELWDTIGDLNVMRSATLAGQVIHWAVWLGESLIVLAAAVWYPARKLAATPYCETCRRWGVTRVLGRLAVGEEDSLRGALERRDFAILDQLGPATSARAYTELSLQGCTSCDRTLLLRVDVVRVGTLRGTGRRITRRVVEKLRLTAEEAEAIRAIVASCAARAPLDVASTGLGRVQPA